MSGERTMFIRKDRRARKGRADVAHVRIVHAKTGAVAYLGEVSGRVKVAGALHSGVIKKMDPWTWVAKRGYARPADGIYEQDAAPTAIVAPLENGSTSTQPIVRVDRRILQLPDAAGDDSSARRDQGDGGAE
jgi:hypothetical protein